MKDLVKTLQLEEAHERRLLERIAVLEYALGRFVGDVDAYLKYLRREDEE